MTSLIFIRTLPHSLTEPLAHLTINSLTRLAVKNPVVAMCSTLCNIQKLCLLPRAVMCFMACRRDIYYFSTQD
jgi:hypothetical protein